MFGLGNKKGGVSATATFDLEEELKDPGKLRACQERIQERVQQLKTLLRQGEDKQQFDLTQTLLHGYLATQKVLQRLNRKKF